ncbi:hypothetical protein EQM14_07070 [Caproiciproducens sp. NJN-50]|uniref:HEPN domain-containing protein n=1 Tax=Caproiciproducens sp. NJN-50 TaxID=2507162 RepID=UPI000FFE1071|nr:HEPN domain-containing protein [Caproiciproducens sp. NJN-50]QAT49557.1 hypothetical protein EQM14_07070 [Caproiciproducens sp. NJN-50]
MINFVEEWYKKGCKEKESVFRFVSYFIAFNYLYASTRHTVQNRSGKERDEDEWKTIQRFSIEKIAPYYIDDTPFAILDDKSEFYKKPVKAVNSGKIKDYIKHVEFKEKHIDQLFLAIYQVRCNLFHGSKVMVSPRDQSLVADGAKVLEDFMKRWLHKSGGGADA